MLCCVRQYRDLSLQLSNLHSNQGNCKPLSCSLELDFAAIQLNDGSKIVLLLLQGCIVIASCCGVAILLLHIDVAILQLQSHAATEQYCCDVLMLLLCCLDAVHQIC